MYLELYGTATDLAILDIRLLYPTGIIDIDFQRGTTIRTNNTGRILQ